MTSGTMMNGENRGSKELQKMPESKVYRRKSFKGLNNVGDVLQHPHSQILGLEDANLSQKIVGSEGSSSLNRSLILENNGILAGSGQENSARINLSFKSKREMREIRRKLQSELDLVRSLVKKIEATDVQKTGPGIDQDSGARPVSVESRPLNQLSVSVVENSHGVGDNVEKEKRTPKVNQFYRNKDFLLAKDKFPPAESNKKSKSKSSAKKVSGPESGHAIPGKLSNQMLKNCRALLERLMKHKHGWVFNQPVDIKALGLHDYFDIIKNPMDLGTVKSRLETNRYTSPKEFAEDVRLTFQNAMTYNPKGQDVHMMADQLNKIFEEKWAPIEADYMRELRLLTDSGGKVGPKRTLDRSESTTNLVGSKIKSVTLPQSGRTPAPKKPKAKDPNKREMTYDEKQKLSTCLQNLPSEKLENVVQIIKKRNSSLCQQDDEIEVDIDSVDTETLWELDRFVTNYKKSLSKNKRKIELADQEKREVETNVQEENASPVVVEIPKESKAAEEKGTSSTPAHVENQGKDVSQPSSSNTDSVSSSSDSDSESSAGGGSDAEHSPKS
ncbi:transcription factor GTE4 isoform X1 [Lycium ferocissimum]|uniref:transcription factor GTE4 isoform X1 n=1 Tax=Lycium ferocissimum TaxID=112874 RepID=UPI00281656CC|nr:transcription factor GTE4 isoform X1 [Lycium ferocissimum]XP_059301306.1 transcription factor GTE4 isoform X1 [Lycium ferocissimum]XP_059301308.1 transcription factor GTE4 isoform X1 [Lycium ferocissimum]XP_059301309.1 transcription factor GTE4 isoform X1 [Lycium ferocissimum]XP_059301310.1 transcription factor GTE4 isoform X1 [Lycium ferocissimum]XP_059301311.1 transcription factor GTE4 isoform X1 [Lycium ferocissimum]